MGYRCRSWVPAAYVLLICMTGGLAWIVVQCLPRLPRWTLEQCPLNHADHVLAKVRHTRFLHSCQVICRALRAECFNSCQLCMPKAHNKLMTELGVFMPLHVPSHEKCTYHSLVVQLVNREQMLAKVFQQCVHNTQSHGPQASFLPPGQ